MKRLTYSVVLNARQEQPLIWRIYSAVVAVLVPVSMLALIMFPTLGALFAPIDGGIKAILVGGGIFGAVMVVPPIAWCSWLMHRDFCEGRGFYGLM